MDEQTNVSSFISSLRELIKDEIKKSTAQIVSGVVNAVDTTNKTCTVTINGASYTVGCYVRSTPTFPYSCRVFIPFDNMSQAFVIIP